MADKSREFGGKQQGGQQQGEQQERDRTDKESGRPVQLEPDKDKTMDRPGQKPGGGQHETDRPSREQPGGGQHQGGQHNR